VESVEYVLLRHPTPTIKGVEGTDLLVGMEDEDGGED
jgi:hypothetical protein